MKEYKVSITGITDFIIISPEVLRLLLEKIKDSVTLNIEIPAEYIMPMKFAEYIKAVINVNRDKTQFRFKQITEDEISMIDIYSILEYQMQNLKIDKEKCFEKFTLLAEHSEGKYSFAVESNKTFFYICQDEESRFTYMFPDGRQERIILYCKK